MAKRSSDRFGTTREEIARARRAVVHSGGLSRSRAAEIRDLIRERRRAGYRARAIPLSEMRQEWKWVLNAAKSGTFIFVTRNGALSCVIVPPAWYQQATATAQVGISLSEAESTVLAAWQAAVGIKASQLIRNSLFGTGVPRCATAGDIQRLMQRVHRVAGRASIVLESKVNGWAWLMEPLPALAGRSPITLLADERGEKAIFDLLICIEHGIPT